MNVLVVGNVLKDVYLGLDARTEPFEQDANDVTWLDISFDASKHHFFRRTSSFGGAAVTLEVLDKMGVQAAISGNDFSLDEDGPTFSGPAEDYRYILTSDSGVSYLTSSIERTTIFVEPNGPINYLFVDRSAYLSATTTEKILKYLDEHPATKLIIYPKHNLEEAKKLIPRAEFVFCDHVAEKFINIPKPKLIEISDTKLSFKNYSELVNVDRIDRLTHLSAYSIAAATILSGIITGRSISESLKLARLNVENSTLSSTLSLHELSKLTGSSTEDNLELIAATMVLKGKGILAADESGGSIKKKFAERNIADTFMNRHDYRDIFFTTPEIEKYLSGIILFDETAHDYASTGESYPDFLTAHRIIPGIKVDQGLENFDNSTETYTKGLIGLPERLREYYQMGLRFAKWRAAFNITLSDRGEILTPSARAITENCRILAEYARACQSAGLVPIVEPEVVYDGNYSIEKSAKVTGKILDELMKTLKIFGTNLRACILKTNMVMAGKKYDQQSTPEEVARATAEVLKRYVPAELAGVVFLSGGQTPEQATDNLRAITHETTYPWPITFSFARAFQDPALFAWNGDNNNKEAAKKAFKERLIANQNALI